MNRRGFVTLLASLLAGKLSAQEKGMKTWYITGGRRTKGNDCTIEPIITQGRDSLEAVANSGITVWSEAEWLAQKSDFEAMCKEYENKRPR